LLERDLTDKEKKKSGEHHTAYEISLEGRGGDMDFTFYSCRRPETAWELLECLVNEIVSEKTTFDEWCDEIGENNDSISALETFEQCKKQTRQLKMVLDNLYHDFKYAEMD
jgi:hypothetical protein